MRGLCRISPFATTASYYARYRADYPAALFAHLVTRLRLDGRQHVLDLGSGTGKVALPLAPHVASVVAVDPEPDMRAEGRRLAAETGITNVVFRDGDSDRLAQQFGPHTFDVVTMGFSFHWMDRAATLVALDRLVRTGGSVVVIGGPGGAFPVSSRWTEFIARVRDRYLPEVDLSSPREPTHADVLARSPFSRVATATFRRRVERDVDSLIGLQLSYSFSAPQRLGWSLDAFKTELRAALLAANPTGIFREEFVSEVIIATRPADSGKPTRRSPAPRQLRHSYPATGAPSCNRGTDFR